jgi:hypothetical protein
VAEKLTVAKALGYASFCPLCMIGLGEPEVLLNTCVFCGGELSDIEAPAEVPVAEEQRYYYVNLGANAVVTGSVRVKAASEEEAEKQGKGWKTIAGGIDWSYQGTTDEDPVVNSVVIAAFQGPE